MITVSEFKVRMTVWCLADKTVQYIKNPKYERKGLSFSQNGTLMALAEKGQDNRDAVAIYDVSSTKWHCLYRFTPDTFDLEDLSFS